MKFHVIYLQTTSGAQSPARVVEQTTGHEVRWVNRYLDCEYVRRLADSSLRLYAHNLLHFFRWWAGTHRTVRRPGTRTDRIHAPGVSALPIRSTTAAFRRHHQRTHRCGRSRPSQ
jgi:hypothetical protein